MSNIKSCPFCGGTPTKIGSKDVLCIACGIRKPELAWNLRTDAAAAASYASVELLGYINLRACKVREIDDLGGKALEVTAIEKDGSDGEVQIVAPAALYRRVVKTKEAALADAKERYREYDPPAEPTERVRAVPWDALGTILEHHAAIRDAVIQEPIDAVTKWYKEMSDIPF